MDGRIFFANLKKLGVPDLENIDSSSYDWIFLAPNNSELVSFWEYFFSKHNESSKLSEEEILQYEDLLGCGQVYSEKYLLQMNQCLQPSFPISDVKNLNLAEVCDSSHIEDLTKQLKLLKNKKNQLSLWRLESENKLKKKKEIVDSLMADYEEMKSNINTTSSDHSKAMKNLAFYLDETAFSFSSFNTISDNEVNEKLNFVTQLALQEWQDTEERFNSAVEAYVDRQLKENINSIVDGENDSSYCLIDAGQMDLQLVRGPGMMEYHLNVKELKRINKMLEFCETEWVIHEIEMASIVAQICEAAKIMERVKSEDLADSIQYQVSGGRESGLAMHQDFNYQMNHIKDQAIKIAQCERLKTISGHYKVKLQRQEYISRKQQVVIDLLMGQLSRYDVLKMMLDIEQQDIRDIVQVLVKLNQFITNKYKNTTHRINRLNELHQRSRNKNSDDALDEALSPLMHLLCSEDPTDFKIKDFLSAVKDLQSDSQLIALKLSKIAEQRNKNFKKALFRCATLEDLLFERCSSIKSWVPDELSNRQCQMEKQSQELRVEMFEVLKDYEGKKKIIEKNPKVAEDLLKWTKFDSKNM